MTTPAGKDPSKSKAERRRTAILEAAIRAVRRGGVDSITHRAVAEEAQVPLGSITYYFESREELITEALRYYMRQIEDRTAALVRERVGAGDVGMTLDTILDLLVATDSEQPMRIVEHEMIAHGVRNENLRREVRNYRLGFEAQLASALEQVGIAKPVIGARVLLNIVDGFDVEQLIRPEDRAEDLRRRLEAAVFGFGGMG